MKGNSNILQSPCRRTLSGKHHFIVMENTINHFAFNISFDNVGRIH